MNNYKLQITNFIKHPLFSGSAIMIIGSNFANFIAYLYHVVIGRLLGPSPYGVLVSILSLLGLVTTAFSFLGLVIVKFVSAADKKEQETIFSWFGQRVKTLAFSLTIIILVLSLFISDFLHVDYKIILVIIPMFFFSVYIFFYRSFLQGIMKFKQIIITTNFDILGRLVLGVLAIYLGLSVFGVVLAIVISAFVSLLLLKYFLRDYHKIETLKEFKGASKVLTYAGRVFIASIAVHSFFSTDVLLVKHFYSPYSAGIFAALSTLGKIIFYGTSPVASVMFPMVSQRHSKGQGYRRILILSILLTGGIAGFINIVYYFLPELMVNMLYGHEFIEASKYLFWYGIYMSIFTLATLFSNFYLSKDKTWVSYLLLISALMQGIGIWFFHETITAVIWVSIISVLFLVMALLSYFIYESKTARK